MHQTISYLEEDYKRANISIKVQNPDSNVVKCDVNKINQVFVNLLKNALDATPKNGRISISSTNERKYCCVTVKDYGKGMTREEVEKAFDPFYTTKDPGQGMGIGLYICSQIIKMHNGSIKIDSNPEMGTEVKIRIPFRN